MHVARVCAVAVLRLVWERFCCVIIACAAPSHCAEPTILCSKKQASLSLLATVWLWLEFSLVWYVIQRYFHFLVMIWWWWWSFERKTVYIVFRCIIGSDVNYLKIIICMKCRSVEQKCLERNNLDAMKKCYFSYLSKTILLFQFGWWYDFFHMFIKILSRTICVMCFCYLLIILKANVYSYYLFFWLDQIPKIPLEAK